MPDRTIRLTFPADPDLAPVASIAVRAAARQVALSETEIDRLRAAVVEALEALVTERPDAGDVELVLRAGPGSLEVTLDGHPVG